MNLAVIPAFKPDESLCEIVRDLKRCPGIQKILVVDDGSGPAFAPLFEKLSEDVILLRHAWNLGKGAAIKTALSYIRTHIRQECAVVTLDADGQHSVEDALSLLVRASEYPDALILGVRRFSEEIPRKSRWGNLITRYTFRLCAGRWVSDTQTGLRAFTSRLLPLLEDIEGERYEYEMNVLLTCARKKIPFEEVAIATIYRDKENSTSHFRALQDSFRIYRTLFSFIGSSLVCFGIDYLLFLLLGWGAGQFLPAGSALITANIGARILSAAVNFQLNRTYVFRMKQHKARALFQYAALACTLLLCNTLILYLLNHFLGIPGAVAKVFTEALLFGVSFAAQKFLIFRKKSH